MDLKRKIKLILKLTLCGLIISTFSNIAPNIHSDTIKNTNLENIMPSHQFQSHDFSKLINNQFKFGNTTGTFSNKYLINHDTTTTKHYQPLYYFPVIRHVVRVSNNVFGHHIFTRDIDLRQEIGHRWYKTNINYQLTPHTMTIIKYTYLLPHIFMKEPYYQLSANNHIKGISLSINSISYNLHTKTSKSLIFYPYKYVNKNGKFVYINKRNQKQHRLTLYLSKSMNNNQYVPTESTFNIQKY